MLLDGVISDSLSSWIPGILSLLWELMIDMGTNELLTNSLSTKTDGTLWLLYGITNNEWWLRPIVYYGAIFQYFIFELSTYCFIAQHIMRMSLIRCNCCKFLTELTLKKFVSWEFCKLYFILGCICFYWCNNSSSFFLLVRSCLSFLTFYRIFLLLQLVSVTPDIRS